MAKKESAKKPVVKKELPKAVLPATPPSPPEPLEQHNQEPLKMTESIEKAILTSQMEDDLKRQEIASHLKEHTNGVNEWKLIHKKYNNALGWELVTQAMQIGTRGVLVFIKEAIDQKFTSTTQYIDNGKLLQDSKGQWYIK